MGVMTKAVWIGGLLAGATLASAATTPAGAVDALGVVGAVGNLVGAATGAPVPVVDERLGGLAGPAGKGKGAGGKLGGGGKHGGGGGSHHHK